MLLLLKLKIWNWLISTCWISASYNNSSISKTWMSVPNPEIGLNYKMIPSINYSASWKHMKNIIFNLILAPKSRRRGRMNRRGGETRYQKNRGYVLSFCKPSSSLFLANKFILRYWLDIQLQQKLYRSKRTDIQREPRRSLGRDPGKRKVANIMMSVRHLKTEKVAGSNLTLPPIKLQFANNAEEPFALSRLFEICYCFYFHQSRFRNAGYLQRIGEHNFLVILKRMLSSTKKIKSELLLISCRTKWTHIVILWI